MLLSHVRFFWGEQPKAQFQALTTRHAPSVAAIHQLSFAIGWDADEIAAMIMEPMMQADGLFVGAPSSSDPVAFVLSRCVLDEAEILSIAVAPSWRGKRLGERLLHPHMQALQARGVANLHLEVEEGNAPALRLYASMGFQTAGLRKAYYPRAGGGRAAAVLMSRGL